MSCWLTTRCTYDTWQRGNSRSLYFPPLALTSEARNAIWLPYDWLECADLDQTSDAAEYLRHGLNTLLPEGEPLTRAIYIWGDDGCDNVQVLFGDNGDVEAMAVVLDPYRSSVPLIEGLVFAGMRSGLCLRDRCRRHRSAIS